MTDMRNALVGSGGLSTPPSEPGFDGDSAVAAAAVLEPGLAGYRDYQQQLAAEISPGEAAAARRAFERGRRALFLTAGIGLPLLFLISALADRRWAVHTILPEIGDALDPLIALTIVLLAWWWRVPIAGRLLVPVSMLLLMSDPPSYSPSAPGLAMVLLFLVVIVGGGLGWLLDQGASPMLTQRAPWRARGALLTYGALSLGFTWAAWHGGFGTPAGVVVAVLCWGAIGLWHWWPGPRLAAARQALVADAEVVLQAAWTRWTLRTAGRVLAVLLALGPLLLYLNALGLERALDTSQGQLVRTGQPERLWFHAAHGRLLTTADLQSDRIFALCPARLAEAQVATQVAEWLPGLDTAEEAAMLPKALAALEPYRIRSTAQLAEAAKCSEMTTLEIRSTRARDRREKPAYDVAWVTTSVLTPFTGSRIESYLRPLPAVRVFVAMAGLAILLLLWARGGDSPLARRLALLLAGLSVATIAPYGDLNFPLWHKVYVGALTSPAGAVVTALFVGAGLLTALCIVSLVIAFPLTWLNLCLPPTPVVTRWQRYGRGLRSGTIVVGHFMVAMATTLAAFVAAGMLDPDAGDSGALGWLIAGLAYPAIAVLVGALARRRTAPRSELPHVPLPMAVWPLLTGAFFGLLLAAHAFDEPPIAITNLALAVAWALAALTFWILVPGNLLDVAGSRDVSNVLMVFVLPVLFEQAEDLAEIILVATPYSSEPGQDVLKLVLVVAGFGPIQRWVEDLTRYLTVRRLRTIEKSVERHLEGMADAPTEGATAEVGRFFAAEGVPSFAIYHREGPGRFTRSTAQGLDSPPHQIELSSDLAAHLGARGHRTIDLQRVARTWDHMFVQFELARLEAGSGCRYLIPVTLGRSLRGLLFLPAVDGHPGLSQEPVAGEVGKLGLALVALRRPSSSRPPAVATEST